MLIDTLVVISVVSSLTCVVLAIVAITFARTTRRESLNNFNRTQSVMTEQLEKTKKVLGEIDKRAAATEKTVTDAQDRLLDTATKILSEIVVPKKEDFAEVFGFRFMQMMAENPQAAKKFMELLKPYIEKTRKPKGES